MARTLGYPSRRAMYRAMSTTDLLEWEVDFAIGPWDEERADLRNGILCSLIDACNRVKGQPQPPIHYMPFTKQPKPQDNTANIKANMARFLKCKPQDLGKGKQHG